MSIKRPDTQPQTLEQWLAYIEALHPKAISMGLERVVSVIHQLQLYPKFPIITVAGTNGKGSICAMLESIYLHAGYQVGCYTSPHLKRYNERVRINRQALSDEALCRAFSVVDAARADISLTYFEMGTLAAIWHFMQVKPDIVILEVGMGGRLDAVNAFEPNCAVVSSIDLDHMEYLGDTRERIGFEKAGVFRQGKPAICGDNQPPRSLIDYADQIGAKLQLIGHEFTVTKQKNGWRYKSDEGVMDLPMPNLVGEFQLNNAACAIQAVLQMKKNLPVTKAQIEQALGDIKLPGRFQVVQQAPQVILDVAHNPHAAGSLAENLKTNLCAGRTLAVFAMLADKDIEGVVGQLLPHITHWYLADIHHTRGAKAADLHRALQRLAGADTVQVSQYADVKLALEAACRDAGKNDRIIVFGSFYTVADATENLQF